MNALWEWIEDRTGLFSALRNWFGRPVPGGPAWLNVWPATIAFLFFTQLVTGVVLWMYYSPGAQTAWESVYYIQTQVLGGWMLRAVHHYAAQVMLVLIGVYLVQTILRRAYRAPREFLFWTIVLAGVLTLALNLTGDLLSWDANGYACTQVRTGFLLLLPRIGGDLYKLAVGGPALGHLTATRFLALHAGVLTAALLATLSLHAWFAARSARHSAGENEAVPYWPRQAARDAAACLAILAVVAALSLQHGISGDRAGVALGAPADPAEAYAAARPEWSFRGLYKFAQFFPGDREVLAIFVIPELLGLVVLLMPFLGKRRLGHVFNVAFIFAVLAGVAGLSWWSWAEDARDEKHQIALRTGREQAERILALARAPQGIPPAGALSLLRGDAKTQGPRLFQQYCASCHSYADPRGETYGPTPPTAPDLYAYASRRWLAGLLDPKQILTPRYFGNTKLRKMSGFVKDEFGKPDEGEKQDLASLSEKRELEDLIAAVSAEAGLKSQRELDARDAAKIKEGRLQVGKDGMGCTDCHKFRGEGKLGTAPELTGYGSREWMIGIVSNPAQTRFYGKKNERMPAYAPSDNPAQNQLSKRDIGLLVDWLRGEWYEEPQ